MIRLTLAVSMLFATLAFAGKGTPRCDSCDKFQDMCTQQCKTGLKKSPPAAEVACHQKCKEISNDCRQNCTEKKKR